jgi:hypothetical protein
MRHEVVLAMSWAVPDENSIRKIAELGPVVEMGAGRGYWAWMLQQVGCDVVAYDEALPPYQWGEQHGDHTFHPIQIGGPTNLRDHGDRTLLLVWPPYDAIFAAECLRNWHGRYLVYVGEGYSDCMADDWFHETIQQCYRQIAWIPMFFWPGVHDSMWVYEKLPLKHRVIKKRMTRIREMLRKKEIIEINERRHYEFSSDRMLRSIYSMREQRRKY